MSHTLGHFFNIFFLQICLFFVNMDPMGAKLSKRHSSYKSQVKVVNLFLNFLPNGSHKTTCGIFDDFYSFSLTWDPMGVKILKRYSNYKSHPNVLKLVLNFPPKNLNYLENERS